MVDVVFVHGLLATARSPRVEALRRAFGPQRVRTVAAAELWETRDDFEQQTFPALFARISAALARCNGAAVLAGSGFGALLALRFFVAQQQQQQQEQRVCGLILFAPMLGVDTSAALAQYLHPGQRGFFASLPLPVFLGEWEQRRFMPVSHPQWRGTTALGWRVVADILAACREPAPATLPPTLLVHGAADAVQPCEASRAWVDALPDAAKAMCTAVFFEGGNHALNNVEEEEFSKALCNWFDSHFSS